MQEKRCVYYDNGFCSKGLKGITKCELEGCVAHTIKPVKKFSELRDGDDVFVVYNLKWKTYNYLYLGQYNEYAIEICKVIENKLNIPKKTYVGDIYDYEERVYHESDIKISFHDLIYCRSYDDFYDKNGQMTISAPFCKEGPWIDAFTEKENAVEYITSTCKNQIKVLDDKIKDCQERKELLEKSIKNCQNI